VCGVAISTVRAFRFTLIAGLFNQTLPSTIGGDAARIWLIAREGAGWSKAVYSVAIDRAAGLVMLAVLVLACLPWAFDRIQDPVARAALVLMGGGFALGPLVLVALGVRYRALLRRWRLASHAAAAAAAAADLVRAPRAAASVVMASLVSHLMTVSAAWLAARSVAAPIDFSLLLMLIPPVLLVATIPVSIAGWGIRESAAVTAFAYAGLSAGDGLLVSVLLGAEMFAVGVLGGVVWLGSGLSLGAPASPAPRIDRPG